MILEKKEDWIEACRKLLYYYKLYKKKKTSPAYPRHIPVAHDCPFCRITENLGSCHCRKCIWFYFENMTCDDWAEENLFPEANMEVLRKTLDRRLAEVRIPMLKSWIKVLKQEIKEKYYESART